MSYSSLGEMFKSVCEQYPEKTAMMYKEKGSYRSLDFDTIKNIAFKVAGGLNKMGVKKGDRIIVLSENRYEWALTDYASLLLGAVTVPIYPTLLPSQVEYIINNCEGKILFLSDPVQYEKISGIRKKLSNLKQIISYDDVPEKEATGWEEFLASGEKELKKKTGFIDKMLKKISREDLASIIYTSGTTGVPKGVMLSHGNFLSNVEGALDAIDVNDKDTFLSFLPLSHVFERMAGHFLAFHAGATIAYAENIETVSENLQEVHPTIMTSVPRFFEKVYGRVMDSLEEGSPIKRKLFFWAIEVGKKANLYKQKGRPLSGTLKAKHNLADKLVYSKLKERVGGRMRIFVSGGAPLSREIGEFFNAAGLMLLEGYGLTESSPVITVNRVDSFKFGAVGLPLNNVEVVIAEDGEILTRGPHVMQGYFKNDEETKESIDDEKWLHTGDIGYLDKDGFLFITDRKKNIIVTSGGKNIAPQPIENLFVTSPYIEQSVVLGDKRKYCTAFIVAVIDKVKAFAKEKNISYKNDEDLLQHPEVVQLFRKVIDDLSADLASYETIKKFRLLAKPFTLEDGELTPSLKIKRNVVEQKYMKLIEEMYGEDNSDS